MATLDWPQRSALESLPGSRSGAWVFGDTHTPVATVFENIGDKGVEELMDQYSVGREQIEAVLAFVVQSLRVKPVETPVSRTRQEIIDASAQV